MRWGSAWLAFRLSSVALALVDFRDISKLWELLELFIGLFGLLTSRFRLHLSCLISSLYFRLSRPLRHPYLTSYLTPSLYLSLTPDLHSYLTPEIIPSHILSWPLPFPSLPFPFPHRSPGTRTPDWYPHWISTSCGYLRVKSFHVHAFHIAPSVLCCAVLCCAVLCCAVSCRAVPCRAVPRRTAPRRAAPRRALPCPALPCRALSCPALPCPALPCLALPCPALPCPALPCPALPCPALPWPALPCPALPCPALPCPALPCPALPCGAVRCGAVSRLAWPCVDLLLFLSRWSAEWLIKSGFIFWRIAQESARFVNHCTS